MAGPSRAIQVVPPGKPQSSLDVLSAANQVVRGIIAQAEAIVNKPTQDWDLDERKYSMEVLAKTAANAIASFNEWMQQDVFIAGAGRLVGCLDGVRRTAKHAAWLYSTSRITGRNHLKSGLEGLKAAFGDRCSLDTNALSLLGKGAPCNEIEATNNATCEAPKKPSLVIGPDERPYTVNDLMNLHGLSRQTVIRLYENEPGVQIIPALRSKTRGRRYRTLRVPRRVYVRMKNRMEVK